MSFGAERIDSIIKITEEAGLPCGWEKLVVKAGGSKLLADGLQKRMKEKFTEFALDPNITLEELVVAADRLDLLKYEPLDRHSDWFSVSFPGNSTLAPIAMRRLAENDGEPDIKQAVEIKVFDNRDQGLIKESITLADTDGDMVHMTYVNGKLIRAGLFLGDYLAILRGGNFPSAYSTNLQAAEEAIVVTGDIFHRSLVTPAMVKEAVTARKNSTAMFMVSCQLLENGSWKPAGGHDAVSGLSVDEQGQELVVSWQQQFRPHMKIRKGFPLVSK